MLTPYQKRAALAELYRRLCRHITDNEARYRLNGEPVDEAMRRMSNAQFLEVEIRRLLRDRGHDERGPSARTLIRVFEQGGFSVQANNRTLDTIARVVGAEDFGAFVREGDFPLQSPEAPPPPPADAEDGPAGDPGAGLVPPVAPATDDARRYGWAVALAAGLLVLCAVAYGLLGGGDVGAGAAVTAATAATAGAGGDIGTELARLVDEHNAVGLRLYRSLPDLRDTAALQSSTWSDGPAYREVVRIASGHVRRGNRPLPERMNRQLLDSETLELRDTVARMQTQEHWTLNFLQPDGMVYKYDQTNFQLYTLRRRGGQWRVWANAYAGEGKVVEANGVGARE